MQDGVWLHQGWASHGMEAPVYHGAMLLSAKSWLDRVSFLRAISRFSSHDTVTIPPGRCHYQLAVLLLRVDVVKRQILIAHEGSAC